MLALLLFFFPAPANPPDLSARFAEIALQIHGNVGIAAALLGTPSRAVLHNRRHFPMQSVYKFPIAMAVLHLVDRGALRLDQPMTVAKADLVPLTLHSPIREQHPEGATLSLRDLLRFAVSESDGTASDVLLRLAGGPASVTAYLRTLGIRDMAVATTEAEMARDTVAQYRNWATPDSTVALLAAFDAGRGLAPASRALLENWMTATSTGLARIKGKLPADAVVAHKTGTSNTDRGFTYATNDIGLMKLPDGRRIAIAVFVSDSTAAQSVRELVIAEAARAAWDYWIANTGN
jgi:beta-lactamase class A